MKRRIACLMMAALVVTLLAKPAEAVAEGIERALSQRLAETDLEMSLRLYGTSDSSDGREDLGMGRQHARAAVPLGLYGGGVGLMTLRSEHFAMTRELRLPDSGVMTPHHFYGLHMGLGWTRPLGPGRLADISIEVGSTADRLFHEDATLEVEAAALLTKPHAGKNLLIYGVAYSSRQTWLPDVPLPWVAYLWKVSDELMITAGPICALNWQAGERYQLAAQLDFAGRANLEMTYDARDDLELAMRGLWENRGWERVERTDKDARLFLDEKRVELAATWTPRQHTRLNLTLGGAFDRFMFEGEDYEDRHNERIDLDETLYIEAQVRWRF